MADKKITVGELLSDESFIRWANGTADMQEARFWDEWCGKNEYNRKLAIEAQGELFEVTPAYLHQTDSEREWKFLLGRIQNTPRSRLKRPRRRNSVIWLYRAAAVLLVAAVTGVITYQMQSQQKVESEQKEVVFRHVSTDYGEQKTIELSDGSSIMLNAYSSLTYPAGWIQGEPIEVQLEGEAYFDITRRAPAGEPAFMVKTRDGTVQVMGTSFIVDTREKRTRVGLEEGAVSILKESLKDTSRQILIRLEPSQLAEFSRFEDTVEIREVNPQTFTSWTRQVFIMDNTPFRELTDRMRRTYGVEVKVNDPALYGRRLTGSVNLKSLDLLIKAISEVLEIDVKRMGNTVVFDSET